MYGPRGLSPVLNYSCSPPQEMDITSNFSIFNFPGIFDFDFCFEFGSGIISVDRVLDRVLDRARCVRGGIEPLTFQTAIGRDAGVVGSKTLGRQK